MADAIFDILKPNNPSIYIFGSVTLYDFKLGWSDIDILCLTQSSITDEQAERLLYLRQELLKKYDGNKYFRSFEGGMLSLNSFIKKSTDKVIYWGTSGQRITDSYYFDSFCMSQLISDGILLYGNDIRDILCKPKYEELKNDIVHHYESIRNYAKTTGRSIYSVGWMFDIARCIYTLKTGGIIAKTAAGEWALNNNICQTPDTLKKAIDVRKNPQNYINDNEFWNWTETLGDDIQKFADVLQKEIENT